MPSSSSCTLPLPVILPLGPISRCRKQVLNSELETQFPTGNQENKEKFPESRTVCVAKRGIDRSVREGPHDRMKMLLNAVAERKL